MPGNQIRNLLFRERYGSIPPKFGFELEDGYSVFIGKNDAGKTTILQWIFRNLHDISELPRDSYALVLSSRFFVAPTTRTETSLNSFNETLYGQISNGPLSNDSVRIGIGDLYSVLLQTDSFVHQITKINEYLVRMGFQSIEIKSQQIVFMGDTPLYQHGSGIRHVVSVLAALTSPSIRILLIDEPEIALEARAQKVLKDILIEASQSKAILIATHSHLFVQKEDGYIDKNYIVTKNKKNILIPGVLFTGIERIQNQEELLGLTFDLLGNSLEDLFFPNNFLIVEGASDQVICEKVQSILGINQNAAKVIAARGIDNISSSYHVIVQTLIPLIIGTSPYSKKVVVLIDQPNKTNTSHVVHIKNTLKTRCILLNSPSLEEYLDDSLYVKAGRDKHKDLMELNQLHAAKEFELYKQKKKDISNEIANVLATDDLKLIPNIVRAVKKAAGTT